MLIMVPSNTPIKVVVIIAAITRARAGPGSPSSPGWLEKSVIICPLRRVYG
ncbi:unknown [Klebsiella variicola CAG:634]|nr:unknown [Klebsiella variicola CAG:634]